MSEFRLADHKAPDRPLLQIPPPNRDTRLLEPRDGASKPKQNGFESFNKVTRGGISRNGSDTSMSHAGDFRLKGSDASLSKRTDAERSAEEEITDGGPALNNRIPCLQTPPTAPPLRNEVGQLESQASPALLKREHSGSIATAQFLQPSVVLDTNPDDEPRGSREDKPPSSMGQAEIQQSPILARDPGSDNWQVVTKKSPNRRRAGSVKDPSAQTVEVNIKSPRTTTNDAFASFERPPLSARTISTPLLRRKQSSNQKGEKPSPHVHTQSKAPKPLPSPLDIKDVRQEKAKTKSSDLAPSPVPVSLPLPPPSLATYLRLELSSTEPPPGYIYRSRSASSPYESSQVKMQRLVNFLSLPPHLERVLWFGTVACLDAWLYTFTILPIRFVRALLMLLQSTMKNMWLEFKFVLSFTYLGLGRLWRRRKSPPSGLLPDPTDQDVSQAEKKSKDKGNERAMEGTAHANGSASTHRSNWSAMRHRRMKSIPSTLQPVDKADILKGFLVIASCIILMNFDASMMYHMIRGQATIKLYVIFNVLEVLDRLLSAIGQDVLECLFSKEALERGPDGRSKVLRPLWLFLLALIYNVVHSTALFYQVITLNVAVNSYSNALLTLLLSNQFVEIKGTVFKRFEKEALFQITCADIVERFQLWVMLVIIATRNLIETNSLFGPAAAALPNAAATMAAGAAAASAVTADSGGMLESLFDSAIGPSLRVAILPSSFTLLPSWAGQALGPFLLVLGTETLVDWVKHAYITKFNATTPRIYSRFLDVLAKDVYAHTFTGHDLVRRLGLPVLPLACLFIRAAVQTYQMFLATHLPLPLTAPAASSAQEHTPAATAALLTLDQLVRRALGRHLPADAPAQPSIAATVPYLRRLPLPSADALIAGTSTAVFCALLFFVLLAAKLLLGMALLAYARRRYAGMKARDDAAAGHVEGAKRVGGWGAVEVDEAKRRWIYDEDRDGLRKLKDKERDRADKERGGGAKDRFDKVERYSMVAKRIW